MELITIAVLGKPLWMWLVFLMGVAALLAFDLGVLNKGNREMGIQESLYLSAFYFAVALLVGAGIWWGYEAAWITTTDGVHAGISYFTGFFIEKALSIDNVFVIGMIFSYFAIPSQYQYRALVWGILAVLVLRGIMIAVGAALVAEYAWIMLVFGAFLVATGIKMLIVPDSEPDVSKNPLVRLCKRYLPVADQLHGEKFLVKLPNKQGVTVWHITPLLLALIVINFADLIFAVDSVPAIFAITTDTFVVFVANIMAILGLRALYFALKAMVDRFAYLKYSLALVLVFIGGKIFWAQWMGKVDPVISLTVTVLIIAAGVAYSLWKTRNNSQIPLKSD